MGGGGYSYIDVHRPYAEHEYIGNDAPPPIIELQSRAKIMRFFQLFSILKCVGLPHAPVNNVDRSGGDFLFPVIRTTLNWGGGVIYVVVSIIFAPDCRYKIVFNTVFIVICRHHFNYELIQLYATNVVLGPIPSRRGP